MRTLELITSDTSTCVTLSTTKRGMNLGTLVVLFDQTFHPLHKFFFQDSLAKSEKNIKLDARRAIQFLELNLSQQNPRVRNLHFLWIFSLKQNKKRLFKISFMLADAC